MIPVGVLQELAHPNAPVSVHGWIKQIPSWVDVGVPALPPDVTLAFLDLGEREAIQLAQEQHADLLLIDERQGSPEAQRRGFRTTGTLGILLAAAESGFMNPLQAYRRLLEHTTFRKSSALEALFLAEISALTSIHSASKPPKKQAGGIRLPVIIVHCDWSTNSDKRWMSRAVLDGGKYIASAPELVGELPTFLQRMQEKRPDSGSTLIGFDFPIGLPKAYANMMGVTKFCAFLKPLTLDAEFFQVCEHQTEISLKRPFYPNAPGGRLLTHLTDALGLARTELLRTCDRGNEIRGEAAALFWTLGAKQVGKAAITGWGQVLAPVLRASEVKIWPFDGPLDSLLKPAATVVTETYPAQYYADIFGSLAGSKGDQEVRAEAAPRILNSVKDRAEYLKLSPELEAEIQIGFSIGKDDAFDAAIGLFGMIDAIQNYGPHLEPKDSTIRNIEGWILGQPCL